MQCNLIWFSPVTERASRNSHHLTTALVDKYKTPTKRDEVFCVDKLSTEKISKKAYVRNELQNKFRDLYENFSKSKFQRNAKLSKSYENVRRSSQQVDLTTCQCNDKNSSLSYGKIMNQALQIYEYNEAEKKKFLEKQIKVSSSINRKNIQEKLRPREKFRGEVKKQPRNNYSCNKEIIYKKYLTGKQKQIESYKQDARSELKSRAEKKYHVKLYEESKEVFPINKYKNYRRN